MSSFFIGIKNELPLKMPAWEASLRSKGQVALEGNFRFVLDKSDLKSASDKKFVRKAIVALKNKICEQNTPPCFSALSSVN